MDPAFGIASLIGIAPAMILMYMVLRKYTYPAVERPFFSDPYFFGLFVVGMISGTILFAVYRMLKISSILSAILFAILEVMVLLVVLNLKRFHAKSDTVFYGYGLGLGFGATMSVGMIFTLMDAASAAASLAVSDYLILIVYTVSKTMVLASAGLTVGEGVARLRIVEFTAKAIFMNMIFHLLFALWFMQPEELMGFIGMFGGLIAASVFFYKTAYSDLPGVVRAVLRQEGIIRDDIPR